MQSDQVDQRELESRFQAVQQAEALPETERGLKVALALEDYAAALRQHKRALDAVNAEAKARAIRAEYYKKELAEDNTADWQVTLSMHQGAKEAANLESSQFPSNAILPKLLLSDDGDWASLARSGLFKKRIGKAIALAGIGIGIFLEAVNYEQSMPYRAFDSWVMLALKVVGVGAVIAGVVVFLRGFRKNKPSSVNRQGR